MTDFTDGPWRSDGNGVHSGIKCVATTHAEDRHQRHADARLIAAAPNLLAAIKAMIDEFRALDLPYGSEAYTKAVSAYNKATEGNQ